MRVAPVDGVAALRLLADLRRRFRALTAQLEVAQAYASSHGGEAGIFAAEAGAERSAAHADNGAVVVPRLDHAAAYVQSAKRPSISKTCLWIRSA